MSAKHPIIAVTCSSGTGTTSVTRSINWIQSREHINAVVVEGDSLHRYNRAVMKVKMAEAAARGNHPARIIEKDDYRSDCARHGRTKTPEAKRDGGFGIYRYRSPSIKIFPVIYSMSVTSRHSTGTV